MVNICPTCILPVRRGTDVKNLWICTSTPAFTGTCFPSNGTFKTSQYQKSYATQTSQRNTHEFKLFSRLKTQKPGKQRISYFNRWYFMNTFYTDGNYKTKNMEMVMHL